MKSGMLIAMVALMMASACQPARERPKKAEEAKADAKTSGGAPIATPPPGGAPAPGSVAGQPVGQMSTPEELDGKSKALLEKLGINEAEAPGLVPTFSAILQSLENSNKRKMDDKGVESLAAAFSLIKERSVHTESGEPGAAPVISQSTPVSETLISQIEKEHSQIATALGAIMTKLNEHPKIIDESVRTSIEAHLKKAEETNSASQASLLDKISHVIHGEMEPVKTSNQKLQEILEAELKSLKGQQPAKTEEQSDPTPAPAPAPDDTAPADVDNETATPTQTLAPTGVDIFDGIQQEIAASNALSKTAVTPSPAVDPATALKLEGGEGIELNGTVGELE